MKLISAIIFLLSAFAHASNSDLELIKRGLYEIEQPTPIHYVCNSHHVIFISSAKDASLSIDGDPYPVNKFIWLESGIFPDVRITENGKSASFKLTAGADHQALKVCRLSLP